MFSFWLCGVLFLMLLYYIHFIQPTNYWKEKHVYHLHSLKRFLMVFFTRKSFFDITLELYRKYPSRRFIGSYQFLKPTLVVRDLDLIKEITVKDFDHFTDHFQFFKSDPVIGQNLFNLEGETWKDMRCTLSPAFTSAKMKGMYTFIQETADNFANHFYSFSNERYELDIKKAFTKFTNDIIATCAFGIQCNSLKDENNEFFSMGTKIVNPTASSLLKMLIGTLFPLIFETFRIPVFPENLVKFFMNLVKENMDSREKLNIIRPDMIHLLMEAKKGRLKHENERPELDAGFATVEESSMGKSSRKMELTDELITAQALAFFIAGFDTSSTMLSLLSHQLAINLDIQRKLQEEIDQALSKCDGKITYEELLKMKYLDQVVSEVLRRYPLGYILTRRCVKDYKIESYKRSEKTFVLEKGSLVAIPVIGIHMDPLFFPNPEKFDPERFSEENREHIVPGSYMPFGSGPRSCIGSRFALLECKTLIVHLLSKFNIETTGKTHVPIRLAKTVNLNSRDGFWLALKKRKL